MNVIIDMLNRFDKGNNFGYDVRTIQRYESIVVNGSLSLSEATNGMLSKINFTEYEADPMTMIYYQKPEFQEFCIENYIMRRPAKFMMYNSTGELYISNSKFINCIFDRASEPPSNVFKERLVFENCEWGKE